MPADQSPTAVNPIAFLNEWFSRQKLALPDSKVVRTGGTDHAPEFTATYTVTLSGRKPREFSAEASSKQAAKTAAAQKAVDTLKLLER